MTERNPIKDQTAIVGVGVSKYSRASTEQTELARVLQASATAIKDAGLTPADIDGVVGGGIWAAHVVAGLGVPEVTWWGNVMPPFVNHVAAAMNAVYSGASDTVLVYHSAYRHGGLSRTAGADPFRQRAMLGLGDGRATTGAGHTESEPYGMFGSTGYAAWAARYFYEFNAKREHFALLAINERTNALHNDNAVMRTPMTVADYLGARMVREPLCLLDMDVPIDGADAVIITTADRARDLPNKPVLIHAATMGMTRHPEEHLTADFGSTGQAVVAKDLLAKSDLTRDDADIFFPYDGFSIVAMRAFESIGYCGPGEAGHFIEQHWDAAENRVKIGGRVPVNPHGGSLSEGGTQGAGHVREAAVQLMGRAGERQVPDAKVALLTPGGFFFNAQGLVLRTD